MLRVKYWKIETKNSAPPDDELGFETKNTERYKMRGILGYNTSNKNMRRICIYL
jgi:hypothetical protein